MIAELGAVAGLGAAITFGVMAWRGRGEALEARRDANAAAERARAAEVILEAGERRAFDSDLRAAAAGVREAALQGELDRARAELADVNRSRRDLYAQLEELGAPIGGDLVDLAIGDLYPHPNGDGRSADRDPDPRRADRGSLPDPAPDAPAGAAGSSSARGV